MSMCTDFALPCHLSLTISSSQPKGENGIFQEALALNLHNDVLKCVEKEVCSVPSLVFVLI